MRLRDASNAAAICPSDSSPLNILINGSAGSRRVLCFLRVLILFILFPFVDDCVSCSAQSFGCSIKVYVAPLRRVRVAVASDDATRLMGQDLFAPIADDGGHVGLVISA